MKATAFNPYDKAWMFGFPNQAWATQANCGNNNKGVTAVNIAEGVDSFDLEVALPGFEKEQINVSFDKLLLTISAEKPAATPDASPHRSLEHAAEHGHLAGECQPNQGFFAKQAGILPPTFDRFIW